jgi:hypothetical protein
MDEQNALALPTAMDLERLSDPGQRVVLSCERAKEWLAVALAGNDIEQLVEMKSQAEAIRVYSVQKQLGKDAELSAAEIVRRAERCIGLAIRKGQQLGTIAKPGPHVGGTDIMSIEQATGLKRGEVSQSMYPLTDGITDEQFDAAIHSAKAEQNLSRPNVGRKARGEATRDRWEKLEELIAAGNSSDQIAKRIGVGRGAVVNKAKKLGLRIKADAVLGRSRRLSLDRVLTEFLVTLESLLPSIEMLNVSQISSDVLTDCSDRMDIAMRELGRLQRRLTKGK